MATPELSSLGAATFALLALAALLIGFSKTSVGGVALISVAVFAAVLPSRLSTGVVLPLLIVGDVVAVRTYHAHANWKALLRLIPAVAVGVLLGVVFVARVDDVVMRRAIGAVLVGLVGLHLVIRRRSRRAATEPGTSTRTTSTSPAHAPDTGSPDSASPDSEPAHPSNPLLGWGFGSLAGFTTTVANAGGPAMSLYLLNARFSVLGFLGTTSWFFFVVNLLKIPFSVGLHLITPATLLLDAALAPAVLIGTWIGRTVIGRIDQAMFEHLVLATTVLAGLNLLR